ncbi:MAG: ribosome hibernation-promoting factor, HPF/YfiA family [Colwellia sp.]
MKINISGHHVEITEGIKQSVENKFSKVAKHYPSLQALSSTITVEPHQQKVEVVTNYEGVNISVNATDKKLYAAIAKVAKKLEVALAKRKGVLSAKMHEKFVVPQSDAYNLAS